MKLGWPYGAIPTDVIIGRERYAAAGALHLRNDRKAERGVAWLTLSG